MTGMSTYADTEQPLRPAAGEEQPRDRAGQFAHKHHSTPEVALEVEEDVALFPADWTDEDFPAPPSEDIAEPTSEDIAEYFDRAEPEHVDREFAAALNDPPPF